jgi:glycosyltransferase involved in cell wall biosynthesis
MSRERVRILRVITRLNVGGPAIHATLLAERLDPARYESLLVTGSESPGEGSYPALYGNRVRHAAMVPWIRREIHPGRDAAALCRLYRIVRDFRPDIVHTHMAKAGALGRIAARLARAPVTVHTYHGHVLDGYFSPWTSRIFLAVERALARRTDCLLAVSPQIRSEILRLGVGRPDQVRVLALGLDLEPLMDGEARWTRLRGELGIGEAPLVGIVARLVPIKRHEDFLAAAVLVAQRVPACRFLVIGDGERRAELEALARRSGIGHLVRFLGWRRDLPEVYAALDLVCLCSANEGSPVSLIEAMAARRAVVATAVGGVPDLIEHGVNGLLTPARDPAALADAIVTLLEDPQRRRELGEAGCKRVYPAFSASRLVRDIEALYRELAP